jgi:hypothetical protein
MRDLTLHISCAIPCRRGFQALYTAKPSLSRPRACQTIFKFVDARTSSVSTECSEGKRETVMSTSVQVGQHIQIAPSGQQREINHQHLQTACPDGFLDGSHVCEAIH